MTGGLAVVFVCRTGSITSRGSRSQSRRIFASLNPRNERHLFPHYRSPFPTFIHHFQCTLSHSLIFSRSYLRTLPLSLVLLLSFPLPSVIFKRQRPLPPNHPLTSSTSSSLPPSHPFPKTLSITFRPVSPRTAIFFLPLSYFPPCQFHPIVLKFRPSIPGVDPGRVRNVLTPL